MRLCLHCKTLNRSTAIYCEGCGQSLGCRVCRQCGRANSMTSHFCAQCSSVQLTIPVFYLPLGWLLRIVVLIALYALIRALNPQLQPLWMQIICIGQVALSWLALGTVAWLIALSLLPEKIAKALRALTKNTVSLLGHGLKGFLRFLLWLLGASRLLVR